MYVPNGIISPTQKTAIKKIAVKRLIRSSASFKSLKNPDAINLNSCSLDELMAYAELLGIGLHQIVKKRQEIFNDIRDRVAAKNGSMNFPEG